MPLGIFARTFARGGLAATLDAVVDSGLRTIQFNMALAGGPSLPAEIPAELAAHVREQAGRRKLAMAAVSGTYNMAHPDPAVRADGARRLATLIAAAPALGTAVVTLCTGTRDARDMWRRHPGNATPEAWRDMRASLGPALEVAERHAVTLGFEPEHGNVVDSAAAGRRLLDELGSPHLKVVIDAANLVAGGDLSRQDGTLREAFDLLGDQLVLAHAKDVRDDGTIVAAGRGRLDYDLYLRLLAEHGSSVPIVLHGLAESEVGGAVAFLRATGARHQTSPSRQSQVSSPDRSSGTAPGST
jgi:sugar phosphate isomerase/epimerase